MGKHAFLLGVYINPNYTDAIINQLLSDKTNIYIHVNDLNWAEFLPLAKKYESFNNVVFLHDIKVLWGGSTLLQSVMCMLNKALENKENTYFHLITGQDILIKPLEEFFNFFEGNLNSYISYFALPDYNRLAGGGLGRYDKYYLYDICKWLHLRNHPYSKLFSLLNINHEHDGLDFHNDRSGCIEHLNYKTRWINVIHQLNDYNTHEENQIFH